jgi:hypothetical protein|tara:strand:+ start:696 stop:1034 length:339 start_codon:yes stop_codon:yes gene_type:complete
MSGSLDLTIEQGATFERTITIKDSANAAINISSDSFAGQVRKRHQSATAEASFTFNITDGTNGIVVATISSTNTGTMAPGDFVYDIEWTKGSDSSVTRLLEGTATVTPQVTK